MSHYTTLETQLVSEKHLVLALEDMGFTEVEVHAEPQPLVGWRGRERPQLAHVIVRREHLGPVSNDLGFFKNAEGIYEVFVSDVDQAAHGGAWLRKLYQRYAYHVARDLLAEQDFSLVEEEVDEGGAVHLTLRRMA